MCGGSPLMYLLGVFFLLCDLVVGEILHRRGELFYTLVLPSVRYVLFGLLLEVIVVGEMYRRGDNYTLVLPSVRLWFLIFVWILVFMSGRIHRSES